VSHVVKQVAAACTNGDRQTDRHRQCLKPHSKEVQMNPSQTTLVRLLSKAGDLWHWVTLTSGDLSSDYPDLRWPLTSDKIWPLVTRWPFMTPDLQRPCLLVTPDLSWPWVHDPWTFFRSYQPCCICLPWRTCTAAARPSECQPACVYAELLQDDERTGGGDRGDCADSDQTLHTEKTTNTTQYICVALP